MKRCVKRVLILIIALTVVSPCYVYASNVPSTDESVQLISSTPLNIGDDTLQVSIYNDNGKQVTAYSGHVENKQLILEQLSSKNKLNQNNTNISPKTVIGWGSEQSYYNLGVSNESSYVYVEQTVQMQVYNNILDVK